MRTTARYAMALVCAVMLLIGCGSKEPAVAATSLADLDGRTFELVATFTDAGAADRMDPDAIFVITFTGTDATAETQCGTIEYSGLSSHPSSGPGDFALDLGDPMGPPCILGDDPAYPPAGPLFWGVSEDRHFLSSGYVGWYFEEVTAS